MRVRAQGALRLLAIYEVRWLTWSYYFSGQCFLSERGLGCNNQAKGGGWVQEGAHCHTCGTWGSERWHLHLHAEGCRHFPIKRAKATATPVRNLPWRLLLAVLFSSPVYTKGSPCSMISAQPNHDAPWAVNTHTYKKEKKKKNWQSIHLTWHVYMSLLTIKKKAVYKVECQ